MKNTDQLTALKIKTMRFTLAGGVVLMGIKFFAYFITHSNAILTDALESIINITAGAFALFSIHYAAKPKDKTHPYGHGKIEFVSAGFEGAMIFLAGGAMFTKGIIAFYTKDVISEAGWGAALSAFSGAANFLMGRHLIKKGKAFNSGIMVADRKHLISDTLSSIGLVAGLIAIYFTKLNWIDYVITLVFAGAIIYTGVKLVLESVTNLLDKADQKKLQDVVDLLNKNRSDNWIDIHNLRVLKYGSQLHIDCHMTLPWYYTLEEVHTEVNKVETLVRDNLDYDIEFFIHADPCLPTSCPVCLLSECPVRKFPFARKLDWNLENALPNKKHSIPD